MSTIKRALVIDAGNTRVKLAVFVGEELRELFSFALEDESSWRSKLQSLSAIPCIISSVLSPAQTAEIKHLLPKAQLLGVLPVPIRNAYQTPESLGADRLANAVAIKHLAPGKPALAIDIGTCIKFDFVDAEGVYQGGSISPGMRLRYQSLHQFTAALPLLDTPAPAPLKGKTSHESIHSGVINGMKAEILGMIQSYEADYQGLTIFVTGGDASYFDLSAKKNIFANANLTLWGLYQILQANAQ